MGNAQDPRTSDVQVNDFIGRIVRFPLDCVHFALLNLDAVLIWTILLIPLRTYVTPTK